MFVSCLAPLLGPSPLVDPLIARVGEQRLVARQAAAGFKPLFPFRLRVSRVRIEIPMIDTSCICSRRMTYHLSRGVKKFLGGPFGGGTFFPRRGRRRDALPRKVARFVGPRAVARRRAGLEYLCRFRCCHAG